MCGKLFRRMISRHALGSWSFVKSFNSVQSEDPDSRMFQIYTVARQRVRCWYKLLGDKVERGTRGGNPLVIPSARITSRSMIRAPVSFLPSYTGNTSLVKRQGLTSIIGYLILFEFITPTIFQYFQLKKLTWNPHLVSSKLASTEERKKERKREDETSGVEKLKWGIISWRQDGGSFSTLVIFSIHRLENIFTCISPPFIAALHSHPSRNDE